MEILWDRMYLLGGSYRLALGALNAAVLHMEASLLRRQATPSRQGDDIAYKQAV